MRFNVKFTNGAWKLFDAWDYTDVGIFGLEKAAREACDEANLEQAGATFRGR